MTEAALYFVPVERTNARLVFQADGELVGAVDDYLGAYWSLGDESHDAETMEAAVAALLEAWRMRFPDA